MNGATQAAILFPGQGSTVTESRAAAERYCGELVQTAERLTGTNPFERAAESTLYAQPAIFIASLAGWRAVTRTEIEPVAFAGHSLGEIAALAAAEVFTAEDALELVVTRARLMHETVVAAPAGGMLAILKGSVEQAEQLARENGLRVANYNAPGQTVLSGPSDALDEASRAARRQGLRALRLSVDGAYHSPAMTPVRGPFLNALQQFRTSPATSPVFSSLTGAPFGAEPIELADALSAPVHWSDTMNALHQLGAHTYIDVGPDRVLAGLVGRNLADATVIDPEELGVLA